MLQTAATLSKSQIAFFGDYIDRQLHDQAVYPMYRAYDRQRKNGKPVDANSIARRLRQTIDAEMRRRTVENNRVLALLSKMTDPRDVLNTIHDFYAMDRNERNRLLGDC